MRIIFAAIIIIISSSQTFSQEDSIPDGEYKEYYQNGELKIEGFYKNGYPDSTWKYYEIDGDLEATGNYKQCDFEIGPTRVIGGCCGYNTTKFIGRKQGTWKYYLDNEIYQMTTYHCGLKIGTEYTYYDSIRIESTATYNNGKLQLDTYYNENGFIESVSKVEYVYEVEKKKPELTRREIDVVETVYEFFESGALKASYKQGNNGYIGEYIEYYENGQFKKRENYNNDSYEGEQFEYYPNGWIKKKSEYKDDELHGTVCYCDENGCCYKTETWKKGKLIKTAHNKRYKQ